MQQQQQQQHTSQGLQLGDDSAVKSSVSKYYGETLQSSNDLKTSACCTAKAPPDNIRKILAQLPDDIVSRYYGCGSPFPVGLEGSGLRVLDLGCGTGRDCYVCAALVGEKGFVTGIDMTDAQLAFATQHSTAWQQHLGYDQPNMRFVKGAIEQLEAAGIAAGSVDVIISNCVINLSADKPAVLREAYRALAEGGEVYFSDVYCDRRLPAEVRLHEVLLGECLGGALAINDFVRLCKQVGFSDPRVLEASPIEVHDPQLRELLGEAAFYSVTFRLYKLPGQLEAPPQEDYGQTVTYKGGIQGAEGAYVLDSTTTLPAGVPVHVSGNTAAMCSASWLARHFEVSGDTSRHLGQFKSHTNSSSSSSGGSNTDVVDGLYVAALATAATAGGGGSAGCCPPSDSQQQKATGGCCPKPAAPAAAAVGGGCCPPKAQQGGSGGCCPPKAAATPAAAAANACGSNGKTSGGCCPKQADVVPSASAANACGSNGSSGGCCPPSGSQQQKATGGCCPKPAAPVAAAAVGGGCCPPKTQQGGGGGCCPPKAAATTAAAAVSACGSNGSSGGCCPPKKQQSSGDGCGPTAESAANGCGSKGSGGCCPPQQAVAPPGGCGSNGSSGRCCGP